MIDVFISYSRCDKTFALQLIGALEQGDFTFWFDRNEVFPAGKFREDIRAGIEEAGAFLFLLSPDSVTSEECNNELAYAVSCGKKLIPVVHRAVDYDCVPQALREWAWIEGASFDQLVEKVFDVLLVDKDDWNRAGRWQRLSREWDKKQKQKGKNQKQKEKSQRQDASPLLYGAELKSAESWVKITANGQLEGSHKKPLPDKIQIKFIRASRRARNRFWLTIALVVLLLIGFTGGSLVLSLYHDPTLVTTQQDGPVGSLRWAVASAPSNSTITFAPNLSGKTIALTGDLVIPGNKHLTLKYAGAGKLHISLPRNTLLIDARAALTLFNFSLLGGASNPETLITNYGTLTLNESTVSGNNTAYGRFGGGINNSGTMAITNSIISGNTVFDNGGGGIYNTGRMTLTNSTVSGNRASEYDDGGGGIYNSGTMTLTNSTVSGNTVSELGGAGIYNNSGTMTLTNSIISGNTASGSDGGGGGIYNNSGTMMLTNSTVSGNTVSQSNDGGGGIYNNSGTMMLTNSTVSENTVSDNGDSGGGINNTGRMMLTNSTISGNTASGFGGGLLNSGGAMTLTNSTISGNTALSFGGGGILNDGRMTLTNSTISENTASGMLTNNPTYTASEFGGGGIYNDGTVSLIFCTLYGNRATDGGGLITQNQTFGSSSTPGDSTLQNSLIAGNSAPHHPDIAGKLTSKGYNLIQDAVGVNSLQRTDLTGFSLVSLAIDPSLQLNGSPMTKTHALLPGSPAIGVVPLPSCQIKEIYDEHTRRYLDQRGMVRPGNKKTACDVGAYETQM